ncbi:hypothetical protein HSBGL_0903 [Halapricum desulfuricans]|uniref:Right handed beta helix domain-containing protein n=1 Tax=Halapricum desulfuricans TaxID=2841257 RepID=A0A897NK51_9EURY|nr:right-handed parallel beta-helix repeat-containing protein [Halapricum desulfuricans]QSG11333.1 hypothetical protein HSBGL_0903 [Halapricum desulfuricans]
MAETADYYLAPDGDDTNPGTESEPFGTLQTLLSTLAAGDLGYVRGGTYYPTGFADGSGQQGTDTAHIRLEGYPGEDVVFDFGNDTYGGLRLWDCAYWELRNFTVRNAPSYGIYLFGDTQNTLVENVTVDGSGGDPNTSGGGITAYKAPDTTIRNCVSKNNYDAPSGGSHADGIAVDSSPGCVIEDSVSHGNSDDGFDLWEAEDQTIRDCLAYDNGFDPDGNEAGDGNGFKLGGGSTSGGHRIERCVSYRNAARGFHYNEADIPVEVFNCTAWDNSTNFWFAEVEHVLRNNLSHEGTVSTGSVVNDQYNSWNLGISEPSFESTDPTSTDFLRLSPDSPAIDAGTDVGLSFEGDAPDLGAYETGSTTQTTTAEPTLNVATAASDGTVGFQAATIRYYDGAQWVAEPVSYYDGTEFVTVAGGTTSDSTDDGSTDPTDPNLIDSFESGDLSAYNGDLSSFAVTSEQAADGTNSLGSTGGQSNWRSIRSTSGLDTYVPHGSTFRVNVYLTSTGDSAIVRFGVAGSNNWIGAGYNANENAIQISEAVGGSWSQLGTGSLSPTTGEWMQFEIAWGVSADDAVEITVYDAAGTQIGSGTATASDHRADDGIGLEYTLQYGGTGPVYFDHFRLV